MALGIGIFIYGSVQSAKSILVLSRRWYILQLPQDYLLLPLGGVVAGWWWSGREERSDVLHRGSNIYILQESITVTAV